MSEGIDLQQSDCVVMLDFPSVLRNAEQRIGRADRLNSPHKVIKVYFPNDTEFFSLKTDLKLFKTLEESRLLIGNNMELPLNLVEKFEQKITILKPKEVFKILKENEEKEDVNWSDYTDVYKAIYDLYSGTNPLISNFIYEKIKKVSSEVLVKLSIAKGSSEWAFIALKGSKLNPPKWFFIESNGKAISDLNQICLKLRIKLSNSELREEKWNKSFNEKLKRYSRILNRHEIELLPRKRRKAIDVAKIILENMLKRNDEKYKLINDILNLFRPNYGDLKVNFYLFSQQWLEIFNQQLHILRKNRKRKSTIYTIDSFKKEHLSMIENFLTFEKLSLIYENAPYNEPIWQNVVACIIGIKTVSNDE